MTTPADWREYELGELFDLSNGINTDKSAYGSGTPFINVLEVITYESLTVNVIPGRVTLPKKILARYQVKRGDVLFNRTSETQDEVGLASVYLDDPLVVFGGFVFRGKPMTTNLDVDYSKYALRAADVRHQITARGQGGIRANIGQRDLKSVVIRLPGKPEQRAIAEAIDDASALIRSLQRLIAKEQAIKQGMMQQLFAGRSHAPNRWRECCLGENLLRPPRYGINAAAVPLRPGIATYIRITDIDDDGRFDPYPKVGVSHPNAASYILNPGELVLARTGASVGKSYIYDPRDGELVYAGFLINIAPDPRQLNPKFLALFMQTADYWNWVARTSMRSGQPGINGREYAQLPIALPSIDIQNTVAETFADVDQQIEVLERRLHKSCAIKVGMVQQLLTGRARLRAEAAS